MANYLTNSELRRWLGVSSSTYDDKLLSELIEEKMDYVNELANTSFNSEFKTVRERHDLTKFKGGVWCVTGGTEIMLADGGWKKARDIAKGDKIVSYQTRTGKLKESVVSVVQKKDYYSGDMVRYKAQGLDMVMTPVHPVFGVNRSGKGEYMPAGSIKWDYYLPRCGFYEGDCRDEVISCYKNEWVTGRGTKRDFTKGERIIPIEYWMKFIGLFLAEGNIEKGDKRVCIAQQVNKDYVRNVLDGCGFNWTERWNGFRICDRQLVEHLINKGFNNKSKYKYIPNEYKKKDWRLLRCLIEAMVVGDGCIDAKYGGVYITTSKKLADDFQEIAIKSGYGSYIKENNMKGSYGDGKIYHVRYSGHRTRWTSLKNNIVNENYTGDVVGFTAEPYHTFIGRNNGTTMVLGNIGVLGIPVHLAHIPIDSVSSMKIYNGSNWAEWVGNKEEGRNRDYWIDKEEGVVYINTFIFWQGGKEVQIDYTYGRSDLPSEVKELTRLLVVRDLLINERKIFALESGSEGISLQMSLEYIDKRIEQLEERIRAVEICRISHVL